MKERSLLVCGAHPDDELFFAGTMAKYIEEGARVTVVCGTRGERGSTAGLCSIEELPQVREAELKAAMRMIGIGEEHVHFLPYEDQKLSEAPLDKVREQMARIIRKTRPQVVVSFDLEGANGHPDHVAMARFTADAAAVAADGRWFREAGAAFSIDRLLWAPPLRPWAVPEGLELGAQPGVDFLIRTERWADRKSEAIRQHRTQLPGIKALFFERNSPEMTLHQEAFRMAWGPRPDRVPDDDLFRDLA